MQPLLLGFTHELVKLSTSAKVDVDLNQAYREAKKDTSGDEKTENALKQLRGSGRRVSRDYLASAILGATLSPAAALMGKRFSRGLHNKEILRALAKARSGKERTMLSKEIYSGKLMGRMKPGRPKHQQPTMTRAELAGYTVRGGIMGSLVQALRDRFAGSAGTGDQR
jgi:hypothetical protein